MAVSIQVEPELRFSAPVALFNVREFAFSSQPPSYDVAADGRFLMIRPAGNLAPGKRPLTVVLNWAEELGARPENGEADIEDSNNLADLGSFCRTIGRDARQGEVGLADWR
jgi:hypothetical protein